MKVFLVSCLLVLAAADVSHILNQSDKLANIVSQELDVAPDGSYQWAYETENGISANARGEVLRADAENPSQVVQGEATWKSPEGEDIFLQYTADENGYQPQGSHIPTPPPIPAAIIRALEYIRAHPPAPENK